MIDYLKHKNSIAAILFFVSGLLILIATYRYPIGDFGNYYYGSKIFLDGNFSLKNYKDIAHFNQQISEYGQTNYFENYIPVPPFSLLFYLPLVFFKSIYAKLIFNLFSLSVFSFSLFRLLQKLKTDTVLVYFLPIILFYSLYNNIIQGQTYLIVTALLIETYLASEKNQIIPASIYIAIAICLKIFPAFILLFFFLKRNYRVLLYTVLACVFLHFITGIIVGFDIIFHYVTSILPRLMNNDIIGAYYHGNQSIYTLLLNLFSKDAIHNPNPLMENQYFIILGESIFIAFVLWLLIQSSKKESFLFFSMIVFSTLIIGRYNTSYGLFILIPLIIYLLNEWPNKKVIPLIVFCFAATINLPIGSFIDLPLILKFSRFFGLLTLLLMMVYLLEIKLAFKPITLLVLPIFCIKYLTFSIQPIQYFYTQNTQGILNDWRIQNDSITLISTMGANTFEEKFKLKANATKEKTLTIFDNKIFYREKMICDSRDNKKNPFIYNDTAIVFLSDLNQAVGFYKLRMVSLK